MTDLFSALGGIGASISLALGSLGFIFLINYSALISGVIHRKQKEKYRLYHTKRMIKWQPRIKQNIQKLLADGIKYPERGLDMLKLDADLKITLEIPNMPEVKYDDQKNK